MTNEPEQDSITSDVAGAASAALVGLLLGGPFGAVAGNALARPITELVRRSWAELVAFRQTNVEVLLTHAAEQAGIEPEEVITKAQDDPQVNRLFQAGLLGAAEALDREKVVALAACLANGIRDGARVDGESVMIRALADLDPVHIRVLAWLDAEVNGTPLQISRFIRGDSGNSTEVDGPDLCGPVLTVLERNSLVSGGPAASDGAINLTGGIYSCTEFGIECLQRLGHTTRGGTSRDMGTARVGLVR